LSSASSSSTPSPATSTSASSSSMSVFALVSASASASQSASQSASVYVLFPPLVWRSPDVGDSSQSQSQSASQSQSQPASQSQSQSASQSQSQSQSQSASGYVCIFIFYFYPPITLIYLSFFLSPSLIVGAPCEDAGVQRGEVRVALGLGAGSVCVCGTRGVHEVGLKSVASACALECVWGRASPSRIGLDHEPEHEPEHESRRLGVGRSLCVCVCESRRRGGLGCPDCAGWA
jgi:hypothetical protein